MSYLKELADYKNIIAGKLMESQDLCKAVHYGHTDFLDQPDLEDPSILFYDNIFPFRFIPEVAQTAKTFITLTFGRFELINNSFKRGKIYLNVFTYRDLFRTDYGCTRIDFIINKIDELMNYKSVIGIGKLTFSHFEELVVNDKFIGASICYIPVDFNRK